MAPENVRQLSFYAPLNPVEMGQDTESATNPQGPRAANPTVDLTTLDKATGRRNLLVASRLDASEVRGDKAKKADHVKLPEASKPGIGRKRKKNLNTDEETIDAVRKHQRSESPKPRLRQAVNAQALVNQPDSRLNDLERLVTSTPGAAFQAINQPIRKPEASLLVIPPFRAPVGKAKAGVEKVKGRKSAPKPAPQAAQHQASRVGKKGVDSTQYVTPHGSEDLDKLQTDVAISIGALAPDGKIWSESKYKRPTSPAGTIIALNSDDHDVDAAGEVEKSAQDAQVATGIDETNVGKRNPVTAGHKRANSETLESVLRKQSRRPGHTRVDLENNDNAVTVEQPQPAIRQHRGHGAIQQVPQGAMPQLDVRGLDQGIDNGRAPPQGMFGFRASQASFASRRAAPYQLPANIGPNQHGVHAASHLWAHGLQQNAARAPPTFSPPGIHPADTDRWSEMQDEMLREIMIDVFDDGFATQCAERPGMTVYFLRKMLTILVANRGLTVYGILHGTLPTHPATNDFMYDHQAQQAYQSAVAHNQQLVASGIHNVHLRRNFGGELVYTANGDPTLAQSGMPGHSVGPATYVPGVADLHRNLNNHEVRDDRRAAENQEQEEGIPRGD